MEYYGPRYKLEVLANNADDHNPPEYLEKIKCVYVPNDLSTDHTDLTDALSSRG
jgi:histone deacetylase 1/2